MDTFVSKDEEETAFQLQDKEVTGFDLGGWRREDGTICLETSGRIIDAFPQKVALNGNVFNLERTEEGTKDGTDTWVSACYC